MHPGQRWQGLSDPGTSASSVPPGTDPVTSTNMHTITKHPGTVPEQVLFPNILSPELSSLWPSSFMYRRQLVQGQVVEGPFELQSSSCSQKWDQCSFELSSASAVFLALYSILSRKKKKKKSNTEC